MNVIPVDFLHSASRMFLLAGAFSLLLYAEVHGALPAADKPNIVLIMADDMGYECIGANGCEDYKTPVIDQLAAEGVRFEQCFANPLCTPSRVKIMTGQYNVRNYVRFGVLDRSQTTFAHQLKAAGYATAIAGKWQLGKEPDSPQHFGFDQACLWQHTRGKERGGTTFDTRYPNPQLEINGKPVDYNNGEYGPDVCSDFLCNFIEEHKSGPFFVYYPMVLVHCPFDATPDSSDWDSKSLGSESYKGPGNNEDKKRHFRDMVQYNDKLVGKIIRQLEASGIRDNTLIIFTGDNGTDSPIKTNWRGRSIPGRKGRVEDAGTRVPFVVSWPGVIEPAVQETELVDFCDILPTLCDVVQVPLPENYPGDGVSLWPFLSDGGSRQKDHVGVWYKGKTWIRTLDYGVLYSAQDQTYTYQQFTGHYKVKDVNPPEATPDAQEEFARLRQVVEDFLAIREHPTGRDKEK
jgi:arylsulfatase A